MMSNKLNINSFSTISVIGKGSYAKVLLVRKTSTNQVFALKVLKKSKIMDKEKENKVFSERQIMIELSNFPFIVKLHNSFQTEQNLYFVLEYCPGGELFELLHLRTKFSEDQVRFYTAQLILVLEYMHSKDIIHGDIKPENILLDRDGYI